MTIIKHTSSERDLLARLMRAEAVGEGDLGMLMVGNVAVNRGIADCLTFKNIRTVSQVIYQTPGGFSGKDSPLFFSAPTTTERRLANLVLKGKYFHPATHAFGFMHLKQADNARQHSGIKDIVAGSKVIVFIYLILLFVNKYDKHYLI